MYLRSPTNIKTSKTVEQERQNGLKDVSVKSMDFQAQFRDFIGEMLL